jgi:hypothetical protein
MLYYLPHTPPPVGLVGPEDTAFWAALGVDPAGRYAVVIGDRWAPADATVLAGTLRDIAGYIDPIPGTLTGMLSVLARQVRDALTLPSPRNPTGRPPTPPVAATGPVTLPHTGIRVPESNVHVTSLQQIPTPDGVAYTATLQRAGTVVGTIHNDGNGGPTFYHPACGSPFGARQLAEFAAASRTGDGAPMTEERLLDDLITEFENTQHVAAATRAGRSALRLMGPIGPGEHVAAQYCAMRHDAAAKVETPGQRAALVLQLQLRAQAGPGQWWQLWTGQRWDDLTPRPHEAPDTSRLRRRP